MSFVKRVTTPMLLFWLVAGLGRMGTATGLLRSSAVVDQQEQLQRQLKGEQNRHGITLDGWKQFVVMDQAQYPRTALHQTVTKLTHNVRSAPISNSIRTRSTTTAPGTSTTSSTTNDLDDSLAEAIQALENEIHMNSMDHANGPTQHPTTLPSSTNPPGGTVTPTTTPTNIPVTSHPTTHAPTTAPPLDGTDRPNTVVPTPSPPTTPPVVVQPTPVPTIAIPVNPTNPPTASPSLDRCGLTVAERRRRLLQVLDTVSNPASIRDLSTPQGMATEWLIDLDERYICPQDPLLLQRWTLAVMYFSTAGDGWFQCSQAGTDQCGQIEPFRGRQRFLAPSNECDWAGIVCVRNAVTAVEYRDNNLVGTIPSEMALLSSLTVWGMERGSLSSTIPTELGRLTNLIFLDFDFNDLTGSLPTELARLTALTQLDVNDNMLTGRIEIVPAFRRLEFLQLHRNLFTGTIPEGIGQLTRLTALNVHETFISGTMPNSICNLVVSNGGVLSSLVASCRPPNPAVSCTCCTSCRP